MELVNRRLTLEVNGTLSQIKASLIEASETVERWEHRDGDTDHWWTKQQSGSYYMDLNVYGQEESSDDFDDS